MNTSDNSASRENSTQIADQNERPGRTVDRADKETIQRSRRPSRKMSLFITVGGLAIVLVAAGWRSLVPPDIAETESNYVLPVRSAKIKLEPNYTVKRWYSGTVKARQRTKLGFELPGKVVRIHRDQGDFVEQGELLAELDTELLNAKRRELIARRKQAVATLDELVAGPREEVIAAAESNVTSLEAQVQQLKSRYVRHSKLIDGKAISQRELDDVKFDMQSKQAQLQQALHQLSELRNGTREEKIAAARAAVDQISESLRETEIRISKSKLKSPFDGTISKRFVDTSAVVEAGRAVFDFVENRSLEVWVGLPPAPAGKLKLRQSQKVLIDGDAFNGTVSATIPEIDPATQSRLVVLTLNDIDMQQVPVDGQVARLSIEETVKESGFWIPSSAIQKDARGLWSCFVLDPVHPTKSSRDTNVFTPVADDEFVINSGQQYRVVRRLVEVLSAGSDDVFVRGTLSDGEQIVLDGVHRLVPDQTVRVANPTGY